MMSRNSEQSPLLSANQVLLPALDAIKQKPVDIPAFFADRMNNGMRFVFSLGAIIGAMHYVRGILVTERSSAIFGFFWNYFDAIGGALATLQVTKVLRKQNGMFDLSIPWRSWMPLARYS